MTFRFIIRFDLLTQFMLQQITIINSYFEHVSGDNNGHERVFEKEEENTFECKMCNYPKYQDCMDC